MSQTVVNDDQPIAVLVCNRIHRFSELGSEREFVFTSASMRPNSLQDPRYPLRKNGCGCFCASAHQDRNPVTTCDKLSAKIGIQLQFRVLAQIARRTFIYALYRVVGDGKRK
ncbi:MAG TPA: hypothetical protein VIS96_01375 [Terrimicrobiaceae bacterium]